MNLDHQDIVLKTCILYLKVSTMCVKYSYTSTITWYRCEHADVTLQQNLEKYIHHWSGYVM